MVAGHAHERCCVESNEAAHAVRERRVVDRRLLSVQAKHGAKQHHDGAEARLDELELSFCVGAGQQGTLPELQQLAHHLRLKLKAEVVGGNGDTLAWTPTLNPTFPPHSLPLL